MGKSLVFLEIPLMHLPGDAMVQRGDQVWRIRGETWHWRSKSEGWGIVIHISYWYSDLLVIYVYIYVDIDIVI